MDGILLFPFTDYWWLYATFTLFVLGMLALDLGVFHRRAHAVSTKEALAWSIVWTTLALVFAGLLYTYCSWKFPADPRLSGSLGSSQGSLAWQITLEYLTGVNALGLADVVDGADAAIWFAAGVGGFAGF